MRPLRVMSLFDGISCGQLALQRAGIPVEVYYASEINESTIKVTQRHFPKTVQLGDVSAIDFTLYEGKIDLLLGGSPCQSLSITMSQTREHLDGKSKLFFEYVRALREIKPKWFLLENVASMTEECKNIISSQVGCEPVLICSSRFSAQQRPRYYWTNVGTCEELMKNLPTNDTVVKDILQSPEEVQESMFYNKPFHIEDLNKQVCAKMEIKNNDMHKRIFNPAFKMHTLTCISGGYHHKKVYLDGRVRRLTPVEYERLQNLPDDYTEGISQTERYSACGNGWTVDVITYILKNLTKEN